MYELIKKIVFIAIERELTLSISQGLDYDPTEVTCEKGTTFEIDNNFLFIDERYSLWKDDKDESKGKEYHKNMHVIRLSDIVYIGEA